MRHGTRSFYTDILHRYLTIKYGFFIALRAKCWESSKDIGSPSYQCTWFAARLTLGLLKAFVRHTNHFKYSFEDVEIQQVLLSNFADLSLSTNLCCVNTLVAKTNTAFQLSLVVNIRCTILYGVNWNPIVLSRQFHWTIYRRKVKKTCSVVFLSLRHSGHISSTSWP